MQPIMVPGHRVMLREFQPDDEGRVLELMKASEDYFVSATGMPAAPGDVQSLYYSLPEGAELEDKLLLIALYEERTVAVIDLVLHHPGPADCSVGLFLVHPDVRRRGIGTALCTALLSQARSEQIRRITATTPSGWEPGEDFLRGRGFTIEKNSAGGEDTGSRSAGPRKPPVKRAYFSLENDSGGGLSGAGG